MKVLLLAIAALAAGYLVAVWWAFRITGKPEPEPEVMFV